MECDSPNLNFRRTWKPPEETNEERSQKSEGTPFKKSFSPTIPAVAAVSKHRTRPRRLETLLVIEDDDSVRDFTVRSLKNFGYNILSASDGQTALELFKCPTSRIDMVITDMIMPKMTGTQLIKVIRQMDADIKILFVSGYNPADIVEGVPSSQNLAFLEKPYTCAQLVKKIRDMLDKKKTDQNTSSC